MNCAVDEGDEPRNQEQKLRREGSAGGKKDRIRQILSCGPCRNGKCDRESPCDRCLKQQRPDACVYLPIRPSNLLKPKQNRGKSTALERLNSLEQLLLQVLETTGSGDGISLSSGFFLKPQKSFSEGSTCGGHLLRDDDESSYVGSVHWSSIMDSVKDLKSVIVYEESSFANDDVFLPDGDTLLCAARPPSLDTVLQIMPPRLQVDRYLSSYFRSKYLMSPIVHTYQFGRQYERFWTNPQDTPVLWISILMSILSTSARLVDSIDISSQKGHHIMQQEFLTAAAQCLMLGNYTRPKSLVVEALLLFCQCKVMMTLDPSREAGIIFSVLTRLAFRCGYHRDPDNLKTLSVFEGEMRRRTWAVCKNMDLLIATQVGLPNNIPEDCSDTRLPSNISDEDFDEEILHLPPSKPEIEPTPILFLIVKDRLMTIFGKILRASISFGSFATSDLIRLEEELSIVHASIPCTMRIRPLSQSFADATEIVMWRFLCDIIYQKCLCLLHRKLMAQNVNRSTEIMIGASSTIQRHIIDLYRELQTGGQLQNDRWMLSAALIHDFLLATVILAISIAQDQGLLSRCDQTDQRQLYLELLKSSHSVCIDLGIRSREAQWVAKTLERMLPELQSSCNGNEAGEGFAAGATGPFTTSDLIMDSAPTGIQNDGTYFPLNQFDVTHEGIDDVDWKFLDQFLQASNSNLPGNGCTAAALGLS